MRQFQGKADARVFHFCWDSEHFILNSKSRKRRNAYIKLAMVFSMDKVRKIIGNIKKEA
jgi:hypothetical protein